jgi:hypothetical protein
MRENLTKPLTIESFAEYDKMDPVKRKAIEAQLFKSGQVEKYREKKIKKIMNKVYVDTIPLFREKGIYKIGGTERDAWVRAKELDTTFVPEKIEVVGFVETELWDTDFHDELELMGFPRYRKMREFFEGFESDEHCIYVLNKIAQKLEGSKNKDVYDPYFFKTKLSEMFFNILDNNITDDKVVIVQILCPRSGKTTYMINEICKPLWNKYGYKVCILPSYWLSSLSSFEKDLLKYKGFTDFIHFVGRNDDVEEAFNKYYGKKLLVVEKSLHAHRTEEELEKRFGILKTIPQRERFLLADEPDNGTWKPNQMKQIEWFDCHLESYLSGSGEAKILKNLKVVTDIIRFAYIEMVLMKQNNHPWLDALSTEDRKKAVDSLQNVVIPRFFQMVLDNAIEKNSSVPAEYKTKWSKLLADVDKSEAQLVNLFDGLYGVYSGTNPNFLGLSVSEFCKLDVSMIFANTKNTKEQGKLKELLQKRYVNTHDVILLNTKEKVTNRDAEKKVMKQIATSKRNGRKTIILTDNMGSRSFSEARIDTVFLLFDKGDIGVVKQKASRVLTGDGKKLYGDLVSLSLDPNRSSNPIHDYIVDEAENINYNEEENNNLDDSIRRVLNSISVFTNENGGILTEVNIDKYGEELINSSSLINVGVSSIKPYNVPEGLDLDGIIIKKINQENKEGIDTDKAITYIDTKGNKITDPKEVKKCRDKLLQQLKSIVISTIVFSEINNLKSDSIRGTLENIVNVGMEEEVIIEVGVDCNTIISLLDNKVISEKLMNTIISSYNRQELELNGIK